MEPIIAIAQSLLAHYPIPVAILSVVGALRLIMKPLFSLLQAITEVTPSPRDNEILAKVMDSGTYKTIVYILDWVASVKLPK